MKPFHVQGLHKFRLATAGLFGLCSVLWLLHSSIAVAQTPPPTSNQTVTEATLEQGRYLATAADCAACHTAGPKGKLFAGGYAIDSPLGTIYSSNITPSKTAGIGNYSEADFAKALREGVRPDGTHLYPAMPYTSYAGLSDADVAAMYAYFMNGVKPIDIKPQQTALGFPFNIRASMMVWNALFLDNKRFVPNAHDSAEVQRGAYLVDTLGHCAACHTPRNALMASDSKRDLSGGPLGSWYAANITADKESGIGNWTQDQLVQYLHTGNVPGLAQAAGPMAEAVTNSLQYLSTPDLQAIAAYLKSTKPIHTGHRPNNDANAGSANSGSRMSMGAPHSADNQWRGVVAGDNASGAQLFSGTCAACHRANGSGDPVNGYPSLYHNTATGADNATNLIATILFGVNKTVAGKQILMPSFGPDAYVNRLSYADIASLSNYVLQQYGNQQVTVSAADVELVAKGGPPPLLSKLGKLAAPGLAVLLVVLILLVAVLVSRRRRHRQRRRGV